LPRDNYQDEIILNKRQKVKGSVLFQTHIFIFNYVIANIWRKKRKVPSIHSVYIHLY